MSLERRDLDLAVRDGVLSRAQADKLWARAHADDRSRAPAEDTADGGVDPRRAAAALAAGVAATAAAAWSILAAWEAGGAAAGFAAAAACTFASGIAARALERRALRAAAALLACVAAVAAPLAVHGLHRWLGYGSAPAAAGTLDAFVRSPYFPALVAAVVAGVAGLRLFASPAVAAVLVGAVWFAAMLGAPAVFGPAPGWGQRALLSALTGAAAIGVGVALDARTRRDVSFWLYLSGLVAFWGGLATIQADGAVAQLLAAAAHVALVLVSIALRRPLFALFGAVGLAGVLGRVAEASLEEAIVPFALAAIVAAAAWAATAYRRVTPEWEAAVVERLPEWLRRLLPAGRRS